MSSTPLPPTPDFTGAGVTEGGFKTAIGNLRAYLAYLLGAGGETATARTALGLGTAAVKNVGSSAGNVVELQAGAKLPAVDGSDLTGIDTTPPSNSITTAMIQGEAVTSAKLATGDNERNWVLARTADAVAGAVGTYVMGYRVGGLDVYLWPALGDTIAGSSLRPHGFTRDGTHDSTVAYSSDNPTSAATLSGTWRAMGWIYDTCKNCGRITLFLRIS